MKGGKIVEIITGKRIGNYGQVPNNKQKKEFLILGKVYIEYFNDELCRNPVIEDKKPVTGITDGNNLKFIGFYD